MDPRITTLIETFSDRNHEDYYRFMRDDLRKLTVRLNDLAEDGRSYRCMITSVETYFDKRFEDYYRYMRCDLRDLIDRLKTLGEEMSQQTLHNFVESYESVSNPKNSDDITIHEISDSEDEDDNNVFEVEYIEGVDGFEGEQTREEEEERPDLMEIGEGIQGEESLMEERFERERVLEERIQQLEQENMCQQGIIHRHSEKINHLQKLLELTANEDVPIEDVPKCAICWVNHTNNNPTALRKCGHTFCNECILISFANKKECPKCRQSIRRDQILKIRLN